MPPSRARASPSTASRCRPSLRPHFCPARGRARTLRRAACGCSSSPRASPATSSTATCARLCAFLGTPPAEARLGDARPRAARRRLSRLDAFLTPDGPRFIEINSDAPAGFGYGDRMALWSGSCPCFRAFERELPVSYEPSQDALVRAVAAHGGVGRRRPPRIAIVDWAEVKTRADQEILREAFAGARLRLRRWPTRGSMVVRRGRLDAGGGPSTSSTGEPCSPSWSAREDEVQPFLEAYRRRLCPFVNSFRCRLSEDKAFFASSPTRRSPRCCPRRSGRWSHACCRGRADWRSAARSRPARDRPRAVRARHRDSLVLKPTHDYGGRSVFVGRETGRWPTGRRRCAPRLARPGCCRSVWRSRRSRSR